MDREQKIELLKQVAQGEQPALPPAPITCWQWDGNCYTKITPRTFEPHPSGIKLTPDEFVLINGNKNQMHLVLDSVSIEPGVVEVRTFERVGEKNKTFKVEVILLGVTPKTPNKIHSQHLDLQGFPIALLKRNLVNIPTEQLLQFLNDKDEK